MPLPIHCIYLHGFASGPASSKAKYFARMFGNAGIEVHVPDLNGNDFSELTLSSQLNVIDKAMQETNGQPTFLMGSSMGGLLSALAAGKYDNVRALILMAPGFGLSRRWHELLGQQSLEEWKKRGTLDVFHYALNKQVPLKYAFIEDAEKYHTDQLQVVVPTLVMHGINDTVVPPVESEKFAERNPHSVQLHLLNSDHGLLDVLEEMHALVMQFLDANVMNAKR